MTALVAAAVAIAVVWLVLRFNRLAALRQDTRNAWSQIDVRLKRRHDLVPNLVEARRRPRLRARLVRPGRARDASLPARIGLVTRADGTPG